MKVHKENMLNILDLAIQYQEIAEKELGGYTSDSIFLAGIRQVKEAVERDEVLEILAQ